MIKRKKRKRIMIVSNGIRGFVLKEVYRRAVRKCFAVHLFC